MRQSASRPTYGDASRFVTSACSGWPSSYDGAGIRSSSMSKSGSRSSARSSGSRPGAAGARVAVDDRELDLASRRRRGRGRARTPRSRPRSIRASGRSTLLTTRITGSRASSALRSTNRVCGSGPFARVDEQEDAVDHRQRPLDLAAEVRVPGRVDDVDLRCRRGGRPCSWRGS